MTRTVAFVTANTFEFDSRHQRAADALAEDGWQVVVVAMAGPGLPEESMRPSGAIVRRPVVERRILAALPERLRPPGGRVLGLPVDAERLPSPRSGPLERLRAPLRRALEIVAYRRRVGPWAAAVRSAAPEARLFVAKALVAVPVAAEAARRAGGRYVYDVADLHVESGRLARLPAPIKAYLARREGGWVRDAAALTAATPALANEVARRFGVAAPVPVMNARPRWRAAEDLPRSGRLADAAGLSRDRPIVLYQGAFRPDQGIEELLRALDEPALLDVGLAAVFLGFGPLEARLREEAARSPGRVAVLPAVPSEELLEWTSGAELAFVGTPPKTINQTLTTPNKLFESLMAGVPVVVAGGTFTARLVREAGAGLVVEPWTPAAIGRALGAHLARPPAERDALRRRARAAALDRYNWEVERERLLAVYRGLVG